jgi:hypothetical protein
MRISAGSVLSVLAVAIFAGPALAGQSGDPAPTFGASTEVSSAYLGGFTFALAGGTVSSGGELLVQCYRAYASNENADVYEALVDAGVDPDVAATQLPWPDAGFIRLVIPTACSGNAVQVSGDGRPCPEGEIPGGLVSYRYRLDAGNGYWPGTGAFQFQSLTDARGGGGDSGRFEVDRCVTVIMDDSDTDGFRAFFPDPEFAKSPQVRGLTGLDTWVWYDFSDPSSHLLTRTSTAGLGPLSITLESEMWVDFVEWDLDGDGAPDATLDLPDTYTEPATHADYVTSGGTQELGIAGETFIYETPGVYGASTSVTWRGVYRVVLITDGVATATYDGSPNLYNPVTLDVTEPYEVISVRSELRNDRGD